MRGTITKPGDLPAAYQRKYQACAEKYVASRVWQRRDDAERAAFEDVRAMYWSEAAQLMRGQTCADGGG